MSKFSLKSRQTFIAVAIFFVLAMGSNAGASLFDIFGTGKKVKSLAKVLQSRQLLESSEAIPGFASDAVVLLAYLGRQQQGTVTEWAKIGFVIGDGSLILTAAHCVDSLNELKKQAVSSELVAISPYYGDVFKVELLGIDEKADAAVLKADWPGHPALELAGIDEVNAAKEMLIAGFEQEKIKKLPLLYNSRLCMERLPVGLLDETSPNFAITLVSTRYVLPGWSGSAIVLPESGKVAGVLGRLIIKKTKKGEFLRRDTSGCSVVSIDALLEKHELTSQGRGKCEDFESIEGSRDIFSGIVDYVMSFFNKDTESALKLSRHFVEARPESVYARLFLAWSAQDAQLKDLTRKDLLKLAETNFKEAVRISPKNARVHSSYGNFLALNKRSDEAMAEIETALAIDPSDELALINRISLLTTKDPQRAAVYGNELIESHPENCHYWYWHAGTLMALEKYPEALTAARKAVDLNPDGLYYGRLADALVKNEQFEEAEECHKQMAERCTCQRCWNSYARFLIDRGKERFDDAAEALKKAESAHPRSNSQRNLAMLRTNLNLARLKDLEAESPEEAEVLCREHLEEFGDNGHYHFALAGILRTLDKIDEALAAAERAVELSPDRSYKPRLANILAKVGRLEDAEKIYVEIIQQHPDRDKYKYWYAEFLCERFSDRAEQARDILDGLEPSEGGWHISMEEAEKLAEAIAKNSVQKD